MRRFLAALVLVALCVSMTGCSGVDYLKASRLYKEGAYAQALPLYEGLGEFADSAKMAEICAQKADYTAAESYFAEKAYEQALPLYEGLGMYADSPLKAITCRYENGLRYLENGDYENAIVWLEPLGNYENSSDRTNLARWLWLSQQRHSYIIQAVTGETRVISLEPVEDGALKLVLEREGHLLGLPYDTLFEMTFTRGGKEAAYQLTCRSESDMVIEREGIHGDSPFGKGAAGKRFLPDGGGYGREPDHLQRCDGSHHCAGGSGGECGSDQSVSAQAAGKFRCKCGHEGLGLLMK